MVQNKHGTIRLLKAGFLERRGRKSAYDQVKTKQQIRTLDIIGFTRSRRYIFVANPLMIPRLQSSENQIVGVLENSGKMSVHAPHA